jgi:hypothetical protein
MDINEVYPNAYLRCADLGGQPRRAQIESVTVEVLGQGEAATQKIVLKLVGRRKRLVLNKTNALALAKAWGPRTENWVGRWLELRPEQVLFAGKMVDTIRVRALPPQAPPEDGGPTGPAVPAKPKAPLPPLSTGAELAAEVAAEGDEWVDDKPWGAAAAA